MRYFHFGFPFLLALTASACGGQANKETSRHSGAGVSATADEDAATVLDLSRGTVQTPAISPNGGTMTGPTTVTITCGTSGSSIYYTLNGSTPSSSSTLYSGPFTLPGTSNVTVKAIAYHSRMTTSAVASAQFTASTTSTTPPPPPPPAPSGSAWVAGYYVGYQLSLYPVTAIDWASLTHIIFGAALPNADGTLNTAFYIDSVNGPATAQQITSLAHQNGRKALMMVGGAGSNNWGSAMSSTYFNAFVQNLINTATSLGFDGLDLDYEPSTWDLPTFAKLVQALRAASPSMLISAPVGWINPNWQTVDPNWITVANYADRVNIMSYGMADAWSGWLSWHSSALYAPGGQTPSSVDASVKAYLTAGVAAAKLGVGAGFYGTCWRGTVTGPSQALGSSYVAANDNVMSYTNIMSSYYQPAAFKYDSTAAAPYLSYPTAYGPQQCNFISYEDPTSLHTKGNYVYTKGLGGVIIWTINQGYMPATNSNPPLQALYQGVQGL